MAKSELDKAIDAYAKVGAEKKVVADCNTAVENFKEVMKRNPEHPRDHENKWDDFIKKEKKYGKKGK